MLETTFEANQFPIGWQKGLRTTIRWRQAKRGQERPDAGRRDEAPVGT